MGISLLPPVLKTLIIINVAVFLLQYIFLDFFTIGGANLGNIFFKYFALWPVSDGSNFALWGSDTYFYVWQLISYQFMHGGLWHILLNMFILWMFGSELENLWGSAKFLGYYLIAGIGAGLAQLFIAPIFASAGPTVGASGSVYGLLLAFGLTFPDRPVFMFPFFIPIPAKFLILIFLGMELLLGFSGGDGVAHLAHLGGAATGFLLLKFGDKLGIYELIEKIFKKSQSRSGDNKWRKTNYSEPEERYDSGARVYKVNWQKKEESSRSYQNEQNTNYSKMNIDGEEITQAKIDEILDKISETGYQNLNEHEKKILFELSKKLK